jgi:hypothetical protein
MGKNIAKGKQVCIRCKSDRIYYTEETIGAIGMTLNTPGPVDPVLVNSVKGTVSRCQDCGGRTRYVYSEGQLSRMDKWSGMASMALGYGAALAGIAAGIANSNLPEVVTFLSFAVPFFAFLGFMGQRKYMKNR